MTAVIKIKPEMIMSGDDKALFKSLPDNMPDTKWTQKHKDIINRLYHTYFSKVDNLDWSMACDDMERQEKWPSGPRMSKYGARYICLNFVDGFKPEVNAKDVWHALNGRDAYRKVFKYAFNPHDQA